jgi:cytidylate kinase
VACAFLAAGIDPSDSAGVIRSTLEADLRISTDPLDQWVQVNGRDVTQAIREPEVSAKVSAISTLPQCRENLVARQRAIIEAAQPGIVAEGRDITTVVAPDARVRLLLTADPQIRMARRKRELGEKVDAAALADQILRRDRDDSKLVNFTEAADGVVELDCTYLSLEQTIDAVLSLVAGSADGTEIADSASGAGIDGSGIDAAGVPAKGSDEAVLSFVAGSGVVGSGVAGSVSGAGADGPRADAAGVPAKGSDEAVVSLVVGSGVADSGVGVEIPGSVSGAGADSSGTDATGVPKKGSDESDG